MPTFRLTPTRVAGMSHLHVSSEKDLNFMNKLIYILFIILCLSCSRHDKKVPSSADLVKIEAFFELLIRSHGFAYTLFGDKPCSIADYRGHFDFHYNSTVHEEGWKSWSRNCHLYPSQNFVLKKIEFLGPYESKEIILINKKETLNVIKSHLNTFQDILHIQLTAEDILRGMLNNDDFLKSVLENPQILGILLGYGKLNSQQFEKRRDLSLNINELSSLPFREELEGLNPKNLFFVRGYSSKKFKDYSVLADREVKTLIKDLELLTENYHFFALSATDFLLEKIQPPLFAANLDDPETKRLYQSYSATRVKIIEAYQNHSIFEATLKQWKTN